VADSLGSSNVSFAASSILFNTFDARVLKLNITLITVAERVHEVMKLWFMVFIGINTMAKLALKRSFGQNLRMSLSRKRVIPIKIQADDTIKDRPFTLPPGEFKPKQSLGQNFLSDQNYVMKIVDSFTDNSEDGCRVVEIGPGPGSLTRVLLDRYPKMTAIELDQRAISFLITKLPKLKVMHMDVLDVDWPQLAIEKGGALNIIANLPYYIVSQVLFSLADSHKAINKAVVTMQLEVAERVTANPNSKQYGIPSVVFQLYGQTSVNFKIPPSVFYPKPKVDSALVTIDFTKPHKDLYRVDGKNLRKYYIFCFTLQ
jgi:ribosomal RNA small subunit methyltransferase A